MTKSLDENNQPISKGDTLIRSYGEYWSRDAVVWDSKKMPGVRQHYKKNVKDKTAKVKACDAWEQRGIYALYSDFKLAYVGMANATDHGIGSRLLAHHKFARMAKRWDSFSWFGINSYDEKGTMQAYDVTRGVSEATIIRTFGIGSDPHSRSASKQITRTISRCGENIAGRHRFQKGYDRFLSEINKRASGSSRQV
jgi:hypothetical protein